MRSLDQALIPALEQRREKHLYRRRRLLASAQGPEVLVDGQWCLNFCSNDYLGLANHPQLVSAFKRAADEYGVGSGASHLVIGHSRVHQELEEALADFCGRPRALLFSSGYQANLGTVNALLGRKDFIFEDRLNHASLLDGGLLSGAKMLRFAHNDSNNLAQRLNKVNETVSGARKLVAVDGIYSMDGDAAPIAEFAPLCHAQNAWLMVDDAHGFGVVGKTGRGSLEQAQLNMNDVPILMGTLGKALGTAGAFVTGSEALIETLIQSARNYIYTTAMPPAVAAATLVSLQLVVGEAWRRQHLQQLIRRFQQGVKDLPFELMPSQTAIQPLLIGSSEKAVKLSEKLLANQILIGAIRPPTVAEGTARLRITLTAAHSEQQIDRLISVLGSLAESGEE